MKKFRYLKLVILFIIVTLCVCGCSVESKFKNAEQLEGEGKYDDAIAKYLIISEKYPDSLKAHESLFKIGTIYKKKNDIKNATMYYNKLIEKYPESQESIGAFFECGEIFFSLKEYNTAMKYFIKVVEKVPNSQNSKKAQEKIDEIQNINDKVAKLVEEGDVAYRNNNLDEAQKRLEEVKELDPIFDISERINKVNSRIEYINREKEFNQWLKTAAKIGDGSDKNVLNTIEYLRSKLAKETYGSNEFELKRDNDRSEKEFQKVVAKSYYKKFSIKMPEYNFSKGGFEFGDGDYNYWFKCIFGLYLNRPLMFPFLKVDSDKAELMKKKHESLKGIVLLELGGLKYEKEPELDPRGENNPSIAQSNAENFLDYGAQIISADVIDARLEIPGYGYLYMSK